MRTSNAPAPASRTTSKVLETPAADPAAARDHLARKLALETDPSDVWADLQAGVPGFLVVDTRRAELYADGHVPGALNLPHRGIDAATTRTIPKDTVLVTYCSGVGCNASTKGALKLAALGFRVKEMIGGMAWWEHEGYAVERSARDPVVHLLPPKE